MNKFIAAIVGLIAIIGAAFGAQGYLDNRYALNTEVGNLAGDLPEGTIIAWHQGNEPIPQGWVPCGGKNATPDLRGKFLRGEHPDLEPTGGRERHRVPEQGIEVHGVGWVQNRTSVHPAGGPEEYQDWDSRNWHILISRGVIPGFDINLVPPYQEITFIMKQRRGKSSATNSD